MSSTNDTDAASKLLQLKMIMFPEIFEANGLVKKTEELRKERMKLSSNDQTIFHNDLSLAIIESNKLRIEILDFEREQIRRVKDIIKNANDAHERKDAIVQAKAVENLQKGKMDKWSLKWEVDSEDGEAVTFKDGFAKEISIQQENINQLDKRFSYERMLYLKLRTTMRKFVEAANMKNHETMLWLPNKEADDIFDIELADLETLSSIVLPWAEQTVQAAMGMDETESVEATKEEQEQEDEEAESAGVNSDDQHSITFSKACRGEEVASAASPVLDNGIAPAEVPAGPQPTALNSIDTRYCFTCKKYGHTDKHCYVLDFPTDQAMSGNPDTASDDGSVIVNTWQTTTAKQPNFCYNCDKWGHTDEFCKEVFPEEEIANFCEVCDREGHTEENCFRLHPHLKAEHDAKQKKLKEKMLCTGCGKMGHMRRWCYKLHPELKPQQYHV